MDAHQQLHSQFKPRSNPQRDDPPRPKPQNEDSSRLQAGDFVSNIQKVRCRRCDDELVQMFAEEHQCDPKKLASMARNANDELAEPLPGQASLNN